VHLAGVPILAEHSQNDPIRKERQGSKCHDPRAARFDGVEPAVDHLCEHAQAQYDKHRSVPPRRGALPLGATPDGMVCNDVARSISQHVERIRQQR